MTISWSAISPQNLLDVQQGRQFLYLSGWVRYFDVFPNARSVTPNTFASTTSITPRVIAPTTNAANGASPSVGLSGYALNSARAMPLYWLCYRHNNQISVVIEPWGLPHSYQFTEGHELDRKSVAPQFQRSAKLTI